MAVGGQGCIFYYLEGRGPERRPQQRLDRRLEEVTVGYVARHPPNSSSDTHPPTHHPSDPPATRTCRTALGTGV